jgi:hypothetical protein
MATSTRCSSGPGACSTICGAVDQDGAVLDVLVQHAFPQWGASFLGSLVTKSGLDSPWLRPVWAPILIPGRTVT